MTAAAPLIEWYFRTVFDFSGHFPGHVGAEHFLQQIKAELQAGTHATGGDDATSIVGDNGQVYMAGLPVKGELSVV